MAKEVTPARVKLIAEGARVPLDQTAIDRIAHVASLLLTGFTGAKMMLPLEVEPSSYTVVAHKEIRR
jgi:hypothetical protein